MKANDSPPAESVAHYFTRVPTTQLGACVSRSARSRKRRRVESRVAVESSRVQDTASSQRESKVEEGSMNRKRTAKSLADSRKGKLTITQMLRRVPKMKQKKENPVGNENS